MRQYITEEATHYVRDWISLALGGLGVSVLPHEYFGGLFLALAAASVMARHRRDPRKIWLTAGTAALIATLVSIVWPDSWNIPVQIAMAASGFGSKPIVNFLSKSLDRVEARADDITDKIIDKVLPSDEEE